jgi:starvation-inducible DNA-binding protein
MSRDSQFLYSTRIDIPSMLRTQVIELLNQTLASTLDLKTQVKQAHWNVKGKDFYQLHELFDEIAAEVEEFRTYALTKLTICVLKGKTDSENLG